MEMEGKGSDLSVSRVTGWSTTNGRTLREMYTPLGGDMRKRRSPEIDFRFKESPGDEIPPGYSTVYL
jgi:hypothetical protein